MRSHMNERVAVVTGANRGLGKETALILAEHGYTVVLACRNLGLATAARNEIIGITNNPKIFVLELDLASRASIEGFISNLRSSFKKLNVLINNAGITSPKKAKTYNGLELNIGTNYFGTFFLTLKLLPMFHKGEENHIVNLTSNIFRIGLFSLKKLNTYHWVRAYAVSKYMILLFTLRLAALGNTLGIKINAIHPGIVRTDIMYTGRWYDPIIKGILSPFFIEIKTGAEYITNLLLLDEMKQKNGVYIEKNRERKILRIYKSANKIARLWDYSIKYYQIKEDELS